MSARTLTCLGASFALVLALTAPVHAIFCPSYSSSVGAASNPNKCGVPSATGTNPSDAEWSTLIETASDGPDGLGWGNGPSIPVIGIGCGTGAKTPARFPCELVEAIAMQETGWIQFCPPTAPPNQVGLSDRTIVAKDCGYGVVQVTTGMHIGETPDWDRARVASEPLYALEVGLKILAEKWRSTACTGDNQPSIVEDWYIATWAYNGLAFVNNPNNPNFDAARPPCNPNVSCAGRPYQERIWGWMEFPPNAAHWASLAPAYPDAAEIPSTSGTTIPNLSEPRCDKGGSCSGTRSTHRSRCADAPIVDDGGTPAPDGGSTIGDAGRSDGGKPSNSDQGCGCALGQRASGMSTSMLLGSGALAYFLTRRRRAR